MITDDLPDLIVNDGQGWRHWLGQHHQTSAGVWLVLVKKGATGPTTLTYEVALEEALCHGWIDGQVGHRDENTYRQHFTPRREHSQWSARNVSIALRLISAGRMQPAGLSQVERAKAEGHWDSAYAGPAKMEVPDDLQAALSASPWAQAMFEILTTQNRYAVLYRINIAKRPSSRAHRIAEFVAMLARGQTLYPQKRALTR
jgi:uncharacterized protein YdeI (YjbR/CyaY-like superfamily)